MDARVTEVTLHLRPRLRTSRGTVRERTLFELELDGGFGEAAPLDGYDDVTVDEVRGVLRLYEQVLRDLHPDTDGAAVMDACRAEADLPHALAAVDLALWDRAGRRERLPVCDLLTDSPLAAVPVNALADTPEAAAEAVRAGYRCVKAKAGLADDAERLAAIRKAIGPDVALRIDVNGAWSVTQAAERIAALAPLRLELVEEPVSGTTQMRALRDRVDLPVAMDETAAPGSGAADLVCLKIGRSGGIAALLAQASLARATGAEVYLASALDGPLGIAAGLHCAAALRVTRYCGLATLSRFPGLANPFPVQDGRILLPRRPGLGATPAGGRG